MSVFGLIVEMVKIWGWKKFDKKIQTIQQIWRRGNNDKIKMKKKKISRTVRNTTTTSLTAQIRAATSRLPAFALGSLTRHQLIHTPSAEFDLCVPAAWSVRRGLHRTALMLPLQQLIWVQLCRITLAFHLNLTRCGDTQRRETAHSAETKSSDPR